MAKRPKRPERQAEPARGTADSKGVRGTPLEAFLVACQKSLARSVRSSQQSAKADNEFSLGERPQYVIDGIDFDVSAGVTVVQTEAAVGRERVLVDFDAPAELRSRFRFRVQTKPIELLKGAKLELANLDPLGKSAPTARMRAWLVDVIGRPVSGAEIELHFARAGEKEPKHVIRAVTDCAGRVDFFVEPASDEVKIVGDRKRKKVFLRSSGRGVNVDEYFVWAVVRRQPQWGPAADASAPYPPHAIALDDEGEPLELISELHRLRIE